MNFFCSGIQFYALLSPYLCFISFSISRIICSRKLFMDKLGSSMQTKHLCDLIHISTKGEVGAVKLV